MTRSLALKRQEAVLSTTQDSVEPTTTSHGSLATAIARQLASRLGGSCYQMWFDDEQCIDVDHNADRQPGGKVRFQFDSEFACQRVQNKFGRETRQVVDRVCGPHYEISFEVYEVLKVAGAPSGTSKDTDSSSPQPSGSTATATNRRPELRLVGGNDQPGNAGPRRETNPATNRQQPSTTQAAAAKRRGLNSFFFGESNRFAEAGVAHTFEAPGRNSPLFIYGSTGSGKSHLLEAITNDFRRRLSKKRCVFLSAEQFTGQFLHSLRGGSGLPLFRRKYRDLDLLAIDDIQFFENKRATVGEFQYTIDHLVRNGKQVIVSADRPPVELADFGAELSARLNAGLVCELNYPDLEGRIGIARGICAERDFRLGSDVIQLICEMLSRDVRRIFGAINRLQALSLATGKRITVERARDSLNDLFAVSGTCSSSMPRIEQAVCELFDLKPSELKSASRRKRICSARMLAMYLSRQYTTSAFSEIGDYYGGRSHSTVIAAQHKVNQWLDANEGIALSHAKYPAREVLKRIESNLRIG